MKIRSCFVANSSTCAFVLLGWKIDEGLDYKEIFDFAGKEMPEDEDDRNDALYDLMYNDKHDFFFKAEDEDFLGVKIMEMSSDDCEPAVKDLNLQDLQTQLDIIKEKFKLKCIPRLYGGMYGC